MVGVVVSPSCAGGLGIFGSSAGTSEASGTNVGKGEEIRIGYIPWDEGIASTFLWKEILEERGFKVTTTQYAAGPSTPASPPASSDFQTDSWLPTTHAEYWTKCTASSWRPRTWYGPTSWS